MNSGRRRRSPTAALERGTAMCSVRGGTPSYRLRGRTTFAKPPSSLATLLLSLDGHLQLRSDREKIEFISPQCSISTSLQMQARGFNILSQCSYSQAIQEAINTRCG